MTENHAEAPVDTEYFTAEQIAQMIPGRPTAGCVRRWMRIEFHIEIAGKEYVAVLAHVRINRKRLTTRTWVNEYLARVRELREAAEAE